MMLTLSQRFLLGIFFGLIALTLLAPQASRFLPAAADAVYHVSGIEVAKNALHEGQFPILTLPVPYKGFYQLPYFQFYSPFPYMVAGAIYTVLPHDPYLIYKITLWLSLFLGAIYVYRLSFYLTLSSPASILTAVAYMCSPYFLININTRAAYTEAIAQGLIPIVLYYSFRCYKENFQLRFAIITILMWVMLCTTHLITYVYTSLFVGLLFLLLALQNKSLWKNLLRMGVIYGFACLLATWYLAPIGILTKHLMITNVSLGSPFGNNWLTPLSTLLSVSAVSPVPIDNGLLNIPLYSAVGWPILSTVVFVCYFLSQKNLRVQNQHSLMLPLLILFLLALFMVWSPFDFWSYLPKFLIIAQYPYRLLSQTMWLGSLLFSFALLEIFKNKLDARHVFLGVILIGFATSSWLPSNKGTGVGINAIKTNPEIGYGAGLYLYKVDQFENTNVPGFNTISAEKIQNKCFQKNTRTDCQIAVTEPSVVQLPVYYYPNLLDIRVNNKEISYMPLIHKDVVLAGIKLQPGNYLISAKFIGIGWANKLSLAAWIILLIGFMLSFLKLTTLKKIFYSKRFEVESFSN